MGTSASPPKKLRELGSSARGRQEATLGVRIPAAVLIALLPLAPVLAQGTALRTTCNGEIITKIEIHSYLAGSSFAADAWTAATGFAGMRSTATRPEVIRAYLRVTEGDAVHRTRPHRVGATVARAALHFVGHHPPGRGRAGDVSPRGRNGGRNSVLVGGSFQGAKIESLLLGTENLDGRGITLELSEQQGDRLPHRIRRRFRQVWRVRTGRSRSQSAANSIRRAMRCGSSSPSHSSRRSRRTDFILARRTEQLLRPQAADRRRRVSQRAPLQLRCRRGLTRRTDRQHRSGRRARRAPRG